MVKSEATPAPGDTALHFALVIPAYNEEEAVAGTLRRALAARRKVVAETPVTEMTVVVVNDGSRDRTQEIIDSPEFEEVVKVRFPENRGYGAAIKAGFRACPAGLVGFMDADGTCDPDFCVPLVNRLLESGADVVLASRLGTDSKMPKIRRVGNRIFAALLGGLAGQSIVDTASGFRVIRRDSLKMMSPLPNGLHFTPAMSCICTLDPRLRIEEVPMPYEERTGRSKLSVLLDGLRFLYTILFNFSCYSPIKAALAASLLLVLVAALGLTGAILAGRSPAFEASLAVATALPVVLLLWTGLVIHQLNFLLIGPRKRLRPQEESLQKLLNYKALIAGGGITAVAGGLGFALLGLFDLWGAGWAGVVAAGSLTLVTTAGMAALTAGLVTRVIWAVGEKQKALAADDYEPLGIMEIRMPERRTAQATAQGQEALA